MDISKLTVSQIKDLLKELDAESVDGNLLQALAADSRIGVQKIYQDLMRQREKDLCERMRLEKLFKYEAKLYSEGVRYIAGVDEAGRGPLAGPVVAAAVILPANVKLYGLNDSKKLSAAKREKLADKIKQYALCWSVGLASVEEINMHNIYQASLLAMKRAVDSLSLKPDHALVDGSGSPKLAIPCTTIVGGDGISASIAAASIIAKTTRDRLMNEYHQKYPQYRFDKHKGYPTKEHLEALAKHGPCSIHRTGFAPVQQVVNLKLF